MKDLDDKNSISACLVVYNEESVIERCLESIKNLADEIIVVHDGVCEDRTLDIARRYTNKIFIREHIGVAEGHRVFAMEQASGTWILQMDGDEYFDRESIPRIKSLVDSQDADGYIFRWELWDGKKAIHFNRLQKLCLFRREKFHFFGVSNEAGRVSGTVKKVDLYLRHRPSYNNVSWRAFLKKRSKWVPVHAKYFFPEIQPCVCFQEDPENWYSRAHYVRSHLLWFICIEPIKTFLAQIKNGFWVSFTGINLAIQQYLYHFSLYLYIWKLKKKYKLP